jgi:hypothetical protein
MLEVALIVFCGLKDRLRGNSWGMALPFAALNGFGLAALMGLFFTPWALLVAALFTLGSSLGWGNPLGAALQGRDMDPHSLEWWQKGPLAKNKWLALAARGLMWFPTMAIAFPLSAWLASRHKFKNTTQQWEASEFIRGSLNALLVTVLWS